MKWIGLILVIVLSLGVFSPAAVADGINLIDLVKINGLIAGLGIAVVLFAFRYIPNETIYGLMRKVFSKIGVMITLGMSRYKWSKPVWNGYIEPWFIDLVQNTVLAAIDGLVAGLKSDNVDG